MNRNWLEQVADMGMVVLAISMLIVNVGLTDELMGKHVEASVCDRYASVCRIASRLRQPSKLFVPAGI